MMTQKQNKTALTLHERIEQRDWFMYINPVMDVEIQIDRALIDELQRVLNRLNPEEPVNCLDIPSAVAGCARNVLPGLQSIHRQGHRVAQVEWLLPQLGSAIHFISDGEMLYATSTLLLPYKN